ncbi:unnamed protein product [Cyclocybe aegerita]|uniref:Pheromone n=1 Tax=Cyclocybe aegerita TaxID=1973307 RepID=A0A8S0WHX7_CYCAE|nr:unnamed protein product [Cyclocybe aegerita]
MFPMLLKASTPVIYRVLSKFSRRYMVIIADTAVQRVDNAGQCCDAPRFRRENESFPHSILTIFASLLSASSPAQATEVPATNVSDDDILFELSDAEKKASGTYSYCVIA